MDVTLQERAYWLLLVFESGLTLRTINDILVIWCKQLHRSLQDFFTADTAQWHDICNLNDATIQKLNQAKEKLTGQAFLVEQLQHDHIDMTTVLDPDYPKSLKQALNRSHIPPILFSCGDKRLLQHQTVAIIGARKADETSLQFTTTIAHYLAQQNINVISGYARGVDRAAYDGAKEGTTTVVLPHGIRKISKTQMRELQPRIDAGHVLLLSQFHPDAQWVVSRAMERNNVVTGLAQIVIVAESDSKGGTWEGANGALQQGKPLYVRSVTKTDSLPGNALLLDKGGQNLPWPADDINAYLVPILQKGAQIQKDKQIQPEPPIQQSLLAAQYE